MSNAVALFLKYFLNCKNEEYLRFLLTPLIKTVCFRTLEVKRESIEEYLCMYKYITASISKTAVQLSHDHL